jgi:uncharacterized protein
MLDRLALDSPILNIVLAAVVVDVVVLVVALLAPLRMRSAADSRSLGVVRAVLAGGVGAVAFAVKVGVLVSLDVIDGFGFFHLAYAEVVVVLPLAAAVVLLAHRIGVRRQTPWQISPVVQIAATYALALIPLGLYGTFVEPYALVTETAHVPIAAGRTGRDTMRVGVLADLQTAHVSDYERDAIARLMQARPDVIVLPGDLFQGTDAAFDREIPAIRALLGSLSAPGGVYAVPGNIDRGDRMEQAVVGTAIRPLRNELARTAVRDRDISIAGLDIMWAPADATRTLATFAADHRADDIRIVLAHLPDAVLELPPRSRIDLVVAGHTHGGQVRFPLLGPLITLSGVPRDVAAGGLHEVSGNRIYVSRGVGSERGQAPRVRLNCRPEISIIDLAGPLDAGDGAR